MFLWDRSYRTWISQAQSINPDSDSGPFYTPPKARSNHISTAIGTLDHSSSSSSSNCLPLPRSLGRRAVDVMVGNSKITDWGEQQSRSSASIWAPSAQADDEAGGSNEPKHPTAYSRRSMARVYHISTLLRLGQMKQSARVELRISPAALAENVFKIPSIPLRSKLQENLHPRRQTQSSSLTGRSTNTEEEAMYDSTYIRPLRQPINPPEVSLIQKHQGFARFLKQHASPPHHRVTAGGRIVPAGPLSPPPMMLLPSINAVVTNPDNTHAAKQGDRKGADNSKTPIGPSADPLAQQYVNLNHLRQNQALETFAHPQYARIQPPLLGQNGPSFGPVPVGATPIGFLSDGSSIVSYNGLNYQSFWDGRGAVMKSLQFSTPSLSQANYTPTPYPQMATSGQYYGLYDLNGLTNQDTNGPPPIVNGTSQARVDSQQRPAAQTGDPRALHNQLASELTALDKFAALHLHEFTSAENAQYTSRRRQLVQQLDSLRIITENDRSSSLQREQLHGVKAVPSWLNANHIAQSSDITQVDGGIGIVQSALPSTPSNMNAVPERLPQLASDRRLAPPQASTKNSLSPAAPAFVPSNTKVIVPDYFAGGPITKSSGPRSQEKSAPPGATTVAGFSDRTIHGLTDIPKANPEGTMIGPGQFRRSSARRASGSYLGAEPWMPGASPLVAASDIEYANVPGFNQVDAPKRYCTTISEFQEVLRRVREQAQLYGCKGGQSKDPAYDAEQDIRWAMADGEPIPLPKSPADHVAHPRPWSWDDSAFNYRPEVAISPIGSKFHTDDGVLPSSSHEIGNTSRPRADSWATNPSIEDFPIERKAGFGNLHRQYQPHVENAPESPAKSNAHSGYKMSVAGLSERSHGAQQDRATPSQSSGFVCGPEQRWTKRQDSRDSQQGFDRSPFSYGRQSNGADTGASSSSPWAQSHDNRDKDSDALSFDSQGIPRSHFYNPSEPANGSLRAAKVNLPQSRGQPSIFSEAVPKTPHSRDHRATDLQAVQFRKLSSDASSEGFLRGLLKSPRFKAARIHQSEPYELAQNQMLINEGLEQERARRHANKENVKSEGYQDIISWYRGLGRGSGDSTKSYQGTGSDTKTHKARSSLAASSYHAFGQLPQYDGAGDALVNGCTPQPRSRNDRAPGPVENLIGCEDTARAEQAEAYDVGPTDTYDYRGLTRNEFTAAQDRPLNARVHRENVDRFLDRIQEEELNEVAATYGRDPITHHRM